jgi:hypothetical protein
MRGWQRAAGAQRSAGWERTTLLSKKHQFELSQRVGELCRHGGALKRLGSPVPFAETSPHFLKCGQSVKSTYYINIVGIERCGIPSIVCTSAPLDPRTSSHSSNHAQNASCSAGSSRCARCHFQRWSNGIHRPGLSAPDLFVCVIMTLECALKLVPERSPRQLVANQPLSDDSDNCDAVLNASCCDQLALVHVIWSEPATHRHNVSSPTD